jgi:TRAP-type C4-dicarboxylate transport system permease small subunit
VSPAGGCGRFPPVDLGRRIPCKEPIPMKARIKSILLVLLDVVELYLPMLAFLTIFVCFLLQIVSRYFFTPLMWPEELALLSFVWATLLGAAYAKRCNSMVAFTLVYDCLSERGQTIVRIMGDVLLLTAFIISFKPSLDYVLSQGYRVSSGLSIPYTLISSVYLVFLVDMIVRYSIDLVHDIRLLGAKAGGQA